MPQRTATLGGRPAPLRDKAEGSERGVDLPPFPAEIALHRAGLSAFVPTERYAITQPIRRRHRRSKRIIYMMKPLIPGFALLNLPDDPPVNWYRIMAIPYVMSLYGRLGGVSERDVAAIAAMETRLFSDNPYALAPADIAELTSGAMRGLPLTVTKVVADVPEPVLEGLVDLFGSKVEIQVPLSTVKRPR
jgi:hypothetical protein